MLSFFRLKGKCAFDKYHAGFFSSNEETFLQITIFFFLLLIGRQICKQQHTLQNNVSLSFLV